MNSSKWTEEEIQWFKDDHDLASDSEAIEWQQLSFSDASDWAIWGVGPKKVAKYISSGANCAPDYRFFEISNLNLAQAIKWETAGFNFDSAQNWIDWAVSPARALRYELAMCSAPDLELMNSGISVDEAIKWEAEGFGPELFDDAETYWKIWHDAGLNPKAATNFRKALNKAIELAVDERKLFARSLFWAENQTKELQLKFLKRECFATIAELNSAGMRVTVETVLTWRNMRSDLIVAAIDFGIDSDDAWHLGNLVLRPDASEILALVKDNDSYIDAREIMRLDLTVKELNELLKSGVNLNQFASVASASKIKGSVMFKWAKEKWPVTKTELNADGNHVSVISYWVESDLSPKDALCWYLQGFNYKIANSWIKSGVLDPEIAKRRTDAGLMPKIV